MSNKVPASVKYWIAKKYGLKGKSGGWPTNREVCEWIYHETGWDIPTNRKKRMEYMFAFWNFGQGQNPVIVEPETIRKQTKQRSKKRRIRQEFYRSGEWLTVRYEALKLHGASCQCCGASRKDGVVIHVDHIKPRSKYPELELELSNLQVLCEECNLGKLHLDETDWRGDAIAHMRSIKLN